MVLPAFSSKEVVSVVVDSLFIDAPIVCGVLYLVIVLLYTFFLSSFAIILLRKRELVDVF